MVNKSNLLDQWIERLCEYFQIDIKTIGKLGNGKKKLNSSLDIATLQSLKNKPELIKEYSQIIIDEVHHIPAVSFEVPLKRFKGKLGKRADFKKFYVTLPEGAAIANLSA